MAMKQLISISFLAGFVICFFTNCQHFDKEIPNPEISNTYCFILGEDRDEQQYFTLAEEFFRTDSAMQCSKFVTHIRSIEELIYFINRQDTNKPIDRIELVTHGNVWSGLSVRIFDGGERAYPKELLKATVNGQLPKVKDGVLTVNTIINVWACGIGTNPLLNIGVSNCFESSSGVRPKVNLTKKFVVFKQLGDKIKMVRASYWPYFFKKGYRPSEKTIARELKRQFTDEELSAILNDPDNEPMIEEFSVPIKWTVTYPTKEARPSVSSPEEQLAWIQTQPKLVQRIKDLSIPIRQYDWKVQKVLDYQDDGTVIPCIQAIGMSTVRCLLDIET